MEKKLYRSTKNKVLGGVCGGLGEYFSIDPVIIRIFLVLAFFPFFPVTIPFLPVIYIILWIALPADTAVKEIPEGAPETKKSALSFIFSLILAFFLIFLGFALLFPDYIFRFMDVLSFLIAFFLIFIAVRLFMNIFKNKDISLFQAGAGLICLSYGIFIILNKLALIGDGVFIEYSKNLAAGILIVLGVSLVFKNVKNKWPALIISSLIFLFIGVFSFLNGNYSPAGFMGRMMNRIIPNFRHFNWKGWRLQDESFSKSISMPEPVQLINCSINNSVGSLKLGDTEDLMQFDGTGVSPQYTTVLTKGVLDLTFDNQASETVLKINCDKPMNLSLNVSAGSIEGTIKNINMEELKISVNGGSVKLEAGEKLKKMIIENNLGDTQISLPRNARIKIRAEASLGSIKIPDEFKHTGNEYIYENGSGNWIDISASVKLGNIGFNF